MARTIPAAPVTVPTSTVFAGRPVVADVSGPKAVRDAAMALYERASLELVADYDPGGILEASGQTAEYRAPLWPSNETTRNYTVGIRAEGGAFDAVVRVTTVTTSDTVDLTIPAGRVLVDGLITGTITIEHATVYETIRLEWQTFVAGARVVEVTVTPDRDLATMPAQSGAVSPDGVTALDERFTDGLPLSVARHHDLCTMLEEGYGRAAGGVLTYARQAGVLATDRRYGVLAEVPQTATGRAVKLAIHYRSEVALEVEAAGASVTLPASPTTWATGSLEVLGETDGNRRPGLRQITIRTLSAGYVRWLSAWWSGVDADDVPAADVRASSITTILDSSGDRITDEFGEYLLGGI